MIILFRWLKIDLRKLSIITAVVILPHEDNCKTSKTSKWFSESVFSLSKVPSAYAIKISSENDIWRQIRVFRLQVKLIIHLALFNKLQQIFFIFSTMSMAVNLIILQMEFMADL